MCWHGLNTPHMLTRRHLRIKVMHHLYAQSTHSVQDNAILLRNLDKSIGDIHHLFAWDISALLQLHKAAQNQFNMVSKRSIPDQALLDHITPFLTIPFFVLAHENSALQTLIEYAHPNWSEYDQHFRLQWKNISEGEVYAQYLSGPQEFLDQKKFIKEVYQVYIGENEFLHDIYEDFRASWGDDLDAAQMMSGKLINSWKQDEQTLSVPNLYKDASDEEFGPSLMRAYFKHNGMGQKRIEAKSSNWDSDRIAKLDFILMKMCIAEWLEFPEIPVKVTLNEYIDLAKEYSTPKSSSFMNGILDKIHTNLREESLIQKVGRGIID